jgi:Protein of unknown function (DUF2809)
MSSILDPIRRHRLWYAIAIAVVIAIGLGSRRLPQLGKYPGDALWTMMVFLLYGFALRRASPMKIAALALCTSYVVEFGQLYQAPWIVAIRHTTIGHLVLGSDFGWMDLVAYTVGAAIALTIEHGMVRWLRSGS